jgi:hypothetical protein
MTCLVSGTDGAAVQHPNIPQASAEDLLVATMKKELIDAKVSRRTSQRRKPSAERRKQDAPVAAERRTIERRVKVSRRRQIDPTTCERDYTPAEVEFMSALDEYKRASGRMFPTCSEVLEVLTNLGYEKRSMCADDAARCELSEAAEQSA